MLFILLAYHLRRWRLELGLLLAGIFARAFLNFVRS